MTNITVNPDAKPNIPDEALPDNVIIDGKGRRLVIEDPDFLTESRIMRALGEASSNAGYVLGYVMPAVRVVQIDDVKVPYPSNIQQIDAAIKRLGREGNTAVLSYDEAKIKAALEAVRPSDDAAVAAEMNALKNS
ncbi:hypothetical protein G3N95_30090 [Paraburkholderia sp. Tr-20389]|uniref:hypothetical protein n=1 Tax=Paraburkholderia sp. Tr-20389 TaxID=2703903 RepID=UPI00197F4E4D|nr:hypothetical protein [Paraburkholderia sp. Tr-20389]MBN3757226.1 hypothetical protein [Paraburkholderia sp. Tr-20389]